MHVYSHENEAWNAIETTTIHLYDFDENSTYIQNPPFFEGLQQNQLTFKHFQGFVSLVNLATQSQRTIFHLRAQSVKILQLVNT